MDKMDKMMERINNGREYRNMFLQAVEVKEEDENEYRVQGYASTYNEPYHLYSVRADDGYEIEIQEQVDSKAFDNADMSDVIMQYDHQGRVYARQSNSTLSLDKNNKKGLFVDAYLGGTEIGRQLYEEIKGGYTSKMSFGFIVGEDNLEPVSKDEKGEVWLRTITNITKVYDVSAVSLPANDYTSISARHYANGVVAEVETERTRIAQEQQEKLERENRKQKLELRIKALKGE